MKWIDTKSKRKFWSEWSVPLDTGLLRAQIEQGVGGTWIEDVEDHPWARYQVDQHDGGVSVKGTTVSATLVSWRALEIRNDAWDPNGKVLSFSFQINAKDFDGDPTSSVFHYNVVQTGPDTLHGEVNIIRYYTYGKYPSSEQVSLHRALK